MILNLIKFYFFKESIYWINCQIEINIFEGQLVGDHAAKQHCSLVELKVFSMKGNQLKFLKDFLELMPNAEIVDFSEVNIFLF